MKKILIRAVFVAMWLPMASVLWLYAASHWSKMDVVTMKMPRPMRRLVANTAIADWSNHSRTLRAIQLDPTNKQAWNQYCDDFERPATDQELIHRCQVAVDLGPTTKNLQDLGDVQLNVDPCAAEASFRRSQDLEAQIPVGVPMDTMAAFWRGVAARKCGDLAGARDAFAAALARDEMEDKDPRIIDQIRSLMNPLHNREDLSAILFELHEDEKATVECQIAHPDFKPVCLCRFGATADSVGCAARADRLKQDKDGGMTVIDGGK